jgi:hypothetical protein
MPRSNTSNSKVAPRSSGSSVVPRPVSHTPSVPTSAPSIQVERPGFLQTVKEGFGFGAGSAIAHNLFRSSAPTQQSAPSSVVPVGASATQDATGTIQYIQCVKEGGTHDACKHNLS